MFLCLVHLHTPVQQVTITTMVAKQFLMLLILVTARILRTEIMVMTLFLVEPGMIFLLALPALMFWLEVSVTMSFGVSLAMIFFMVKPVMIRSMGMRVMIR